MPSEFGNKWFGIDALEASIDEWRTRFSTLKGPVDEFLGITTPTKMKANMQSERHAESMLRECTTTGSFVDLDANMPDEWSHSPTGLREELDAEEDHMLFLSAPQTDQISRLYLKVEMVARQVDESGAAFQRLGGMFNSSIPPLLISSGKLSLGIKALVSTPIGVVGKQRSCCITKDCWLLEGYDTRNKVEGIHEMCPTSRI